MKRVGIYLRVSTDSQTTDNQRLGDVDTYRIHKTMVISGGLFEAGCDTAELLEL